MGQQDTLKLHQLKVNKKLSPVLDSLVAREKQCGYYDSSNVWVIDIYGPVKKQYKLRIRMEPDINVYYNLDFKPFGYFYVNDILFLVQGREEHSKLFHIMPKAYKSFEMTESLPRIVDYSVWEYIYYKDSLHKYNAYTLDCK